MKFIVLAAVILIAAWWWRTGRKLPPENNKRTARSRSGRRQLEMVRCAHCGVHVPLPDAVATRTAHYCSAEHRRIAEP